MPPDEPTRRRGRRKTDPPPLSAREIRFAQLLMEYGKRGTARAYTEAGFPARDTRNATEAAACRIVRKRQFREYLRHLQTVAATTAELTVEEIAAAVANIARADRRKLYDARGRVLRPHEWPEDVAAAVEAVESDEIFERTDRGRELVGYTRKVKTASRLAAWVKLMEWRGMLRAAPELPPLEVLLAALPTDVAETVRAALARAVHARGDRDGGAGPGAEGGRAGPLPGGPGGPDG